MEGMKPKNEWFETSQVAIENAVISYNRIVKNRIELDWEVIIKIARFFMEEIKND